MPGFALDYVRGGVVTYPPGATFGPRVLIDYELVWMLAGNAVYHVNGQNIDAPAGAVVLGRPGFQDGFTWDPHRPTRHAFLHFLIRSFPEDWPDAASWPLCHRLPDADIIRPLFRYVLASCETVWGPVGRLEHHPRTATSAAMLQRAMETLLGAMVVGPVGLAPEHPHDLPAVVDHAIRFMRTKLDETPSASLDLADIADAAGVSREHLCRRFRRAMGVGPMEALRILRLDMAMGLLARSNLPMSEIAQRCGFASADHFSRRFRDLYGKPPGAMRTWLAQGHPIPVSKLLIHHSSAMSEDEPGRAGDDADFTASA
ncbi:MAG: helix-turn-helix transcriptional regulator [Phycisphaeraceae bacterium]|nr:helix-turn-helix transcriptional regulator [Phycisphaeraceae bacterium]